MTIEATITASLNAEAARRDATLRVEPIDGEWHAGFVVRTEVGEAILLSVNGPDRATALRRLNELAAEET